MSFATCIYRGPPIDRLPSPRGNSTRVCTHPDVARPCALELPTGGRGGDPAGPIRPCGGCQLWRDTVEPVQLDPHKWALPPPPPPPEKPVIKGTLALLPCVHRGADTGQLVTCATGCKSRLKVFACAELRQCTIEKPGVGVAGCCQGCPQRVVPGDEPPLSGAWGYWSTRKFIDDTIKLLLPQLPPTICGVAGVPRSGMLPASILATQLQLPLLSIRKGEPVEVGAGSRGKAGWAGNRDGQLLIVDDSVYGGRTMTQLRTKFEDRALYAAVYVRPENAGQVDCYARAVPSPHLFQWNLFNGPPLIGRTVNPALHGGIALDMDGVICHDEASGGPPGAPYNLPRRYPVPLILTGRSERHRAGTEAWLKKWGVEWQRLQMRPDGETDFAAYKARHYKESPCRLMIESCPHQAEEIWRQSGKPVLCPILEKVFQS